MSAPIRYALVPVDITPEMEAAVMREKGVPYWEWRFQNNYTAMLAASPNGGCVTAADLERAAEKFWDELPMRLGHTSVIWHSLPDRDRKAILGAMKQALSAALGLTVVDAPAGEVVDA